jgi:hypothetical protein
MFGGENGLCMVTLILNVWDRYDALLNGEVDVLVMPTLPYTATKIPEKGCSLKGRPSLLCSFSQCQVPLFQSM